MENLQDLKFVIVRTDRAGVHMGELHECIPMPGGYYDVTLLNTRRIWSWAGANSITDLANKGSEKPKECKVTAPAIENRMMAIEVVTVSEEGRKKLSHIPEWVF